MRMIPLAILLTVLASTSQASWSEALDCTAVQTVRAAPAVVYDPRLTVEQFNQKLAARDPAAYLLVELDLPIDQIGTAGIVDRSVHLIWEGQKFSGQIQSAFFTTSPSGSKQVHVLANIQNREHGGKWLLPPKAQGRLTIGNQP